MNQLWTQRTVILLALLVGATGCGGVRADSWTGLTLAGATVYVADLSQVHAMDAASGEILWSFPSNTKGGYGTFLVSPAVGENLVIVASQTITGGFFSQRKHVVWALDRETGREVWKYEGAAGQYVEGGVVEGGLFVIGNGDGNVYALDAESGALRWTHKTGHRVWSTPLIVSDVVYVGSMDRHVYALNLSDGEVIWEFATNGAFASTPAWRNGTLYIGAFDNNLYAIDAQTGTEVWRLSGENWFWGSPVVHEDTLYTADVNGDIYALDAETGEEIWHQSLGVPVRAGPAVAEDGATLLVSSSQSGGLYAVDTEDGFVLWTRESGEGQALSTPVVNGSVVIETLIYAPHRVKAMHVENGRDIWVYPIEEEE